MTTLPTATTTVDLANYVGGNPFYVGPTTAIITASGDAVYGNSSENWTLTNTGTIEATAAGSAGIRLEAGGTIINSGTAGLIEGALYGVLIAGSAGTVVNAGTIEGTGSSGSAGVYLSSGGSVRNAGTSALILGGQYGVSISGGAGAITNLGTIEGGPAGLLLAAGGYVVNEGPDAVIEGYAGLRIRTAAGTVSNSGTIEGTGNGPDVDGIFLGLGGRVSNTEAALIEGQAAGIYMSAAGTVINAGAIEASGTAGLGIDLAAGGAVTNSATASLITAGLWGVDVSGGSGTVLNDGTIASGRGVYFGAGGTVTNSGTIEATGTVGIGVKFGTSGSVTNALGGVIEGAGVGYGITMTGAGTVSNAGTIQGLGGDAVGIRLNGGGIVKNLATGHIAGGQGIILGALATVTNAGTITGGYDGITTPDSVVITVTNTGTIIGTANDGIAISGGTVTNLGTGALIEGAQGGVFIGSGGTVINTGTIQGAANIGVTLDQGGILKNDAKSAIISGAVDGVFVAFAAGTVTNSGGITGGTAGIDLGGGGLVTNTGLIAASAGNGIGVEFGGTGANTLITSGTILGHGTGAAVSFGAGNDLLVLDPGAVFSGTVNGAAGTNAIDLARGATAGTIGGLGTEFINFQSVTLEAGAAWTFTGSDTISTAGTLAVDGHLTNAGTLTGTATLVGTGTLLTKAGSVLTGRIYGVHDLGTGVVTNAGTIKATVGNGVGVEFSLDAPETLINSGLIAGAGSGRAVQFGAGNDVLELSVGAVFSGGVDGGAGTNTLELLRGATTGTVSGFGTAMTRFQIVDVRESASWTFSGSTKIGAGVTVTDNGSLALSGTSTLIGSIGGSGVLEVDGGTATIDGGAKLTVAHWDLIDGATATLAESLSFGGGFSDHAGTSLVIGSGHTLDLSGPVTGGGTISIGAGAVLETAGSVAASQSLAFTADTGDLKIEQTTGFAAAIHGFALGDRIDLATAGFAYSKHETLAFKENKAGTGGTLVITDGASAISLALFGQYTAAGFHLSNDGHGDTLLTYTPPTGTKTLLAGHG